MNGRLPVVVLMALAVMLFASACGSTGKWEPDQLPDHAQMPHSDQEPKEKVNQSANGRNEVTQNKGGSNGNEKPKADLEISSVDDEGSKASDETSASSDPSSAATAEHRPFNTDHPQVLGIAIGDPHDAIISRFGPPSSAYTMDDPVHPLSVLRYAHFAVGLTSSGKVEFVDVFSPQIDPGLNGIRIGSYVDDALTALGEPAIHTEFVMSYSFDQAVLKFDIDPAARQIISIKLFAG